METRMPAAIALPSIIQGGMGAGVSGWRLAHAVSSLGQLGVVSGTGIDTLLVRRLADGDPGGNLRRAMARFPVPGVAEAVLGRYFRDGGRAGNEPYPLLSMHRQRMDQARHQLTALAHFVEVWLARQDHEGTVGLHLLTKIQLPNLASLYGAMLAGVDYVLMGAGIPREIPGILDRLANHSPVEMTLDVAGMPKGETETVAFDPATLCAGPLPGLKRPAFLPMVASTSLAPAMARKSTGRVDGFVIEGPTAGGHNAPPRGARQYNERGEPLYGERDEVDLAKIADLGLPFWVAGGAGHPDRLNEARTAGAAGVQVGTLFAYCNESGLPEAHRRRVLEVALKGGVDVITEENASPTGFPFKTIQLEETLTSADVYDRRERRCDLGYLRTAYRTASGRVDFRCPAEPVDTFVKKGGDADDTVGRRCLCNALMSNVGHAQVLDDGSIEPGLFTAGDDLTTLGRFLAGRASYSAADVVAYVLGSDTRVV
jgi:NAD(P)H-dependent flavin oxidoreductase YrpB (nitropropane dioxygenase family)